MKSSQLVDLTGWNIQETLDSLSSLGPLIIVQTIKLFKLANALGELEALGFDPPLIFTD